MAELLSIKIDHFGQIDNLTVDFSAAESDKLVLTEQQQSDFYGFFKFLFYGSKPHTSNELTETGGSVNFRMGNVNYELTRTRLNPGVDHIFLRILKPDGDSLDLDLSNKNQSPGRMLFGISSKQFIDNIIYDVDYDFDNDRIEIDQFTRKLFVEAWQKIFSQPHSEASNYSDEQRKADEEYFNEIAAEIQSYDNKQFKRELQKRLAGKSQPYSSQVSLAEMRNSSLIAEFIADYKLKLKKYADLEASLRMWNLLLECQQKYTAERHELLRQQQLLEQFMHIKRLESLEKLDQERVELENRIRNATNTDKQYVNIGTLESLMKQEADVRISYEHWQSYLERYKYCEQQLENIKEEARDGIHRAVVLQEEIDRSKLRIKNFQSKDTPQGLDRYVKAIAVIAAVVELLLLIAILILASRNQRVYWLYPALAVLLPGLFSVWAFYEYRYRKVTKDGKVNRLRNNELHLKKQQNDLIFLHRKLASYNQRIDNREAELRQLAKDVKSREQRYSEDLQSLTDHVRQFIPGIETEQDLQRELSDLRDRTLAYNEAEQSLRQVDEKVRNLLAGDTVQYVREQAEKAQQFLTDHQDKIGTFPTMDEHQVLTRLHKLDHWLQQNDRLIGNLQNSIAGIVGLTAGELESNTIEQLRVKIQLYTIHLKSDISKLYQRCLIDSLVNRYAVMLTKPLEEIQQEFTGSPNIKRVRRMEMQIERHDDFLRIKTDTLPLIVISNRFEDKTFLKLPEKRRPQLFIGDH